MKLPPEPAGPRGRIEVIPLIDIIFFLLATFVMVSLSMVKNQGVPVSLPRAASGQAQERVSSVTVTVTEGGRVYLNRELLDIDRLSPRLEALKSQDANTRVLVNADEVAYFGDVVKVLDIVRRTGIEKIAIQTTGAQPAAQRKP